MTSDLWIERGEQPATYVVTGQTEAGEDFVDAWPKLLSALDAGKILIGQENLTEIVLYARNQCELTIGGNE